MRTTFFRRPEVWLVLAVLVVFGRTLTAGFLNWDDDFNIVMNGELLAGNVTYFWTHAYYGLYIPLSYTVWAFLAGGSPTPAAFPFHAANVALHALNAVLVYRLIRRFQRDAGVDPESETPSWLAFGAALAFAWHPLQVESVAWVSGLRDLLGTALVLWALERRGVAQVAGLGLAMLAKPSVVAIPLAWLAARVVGGLESPRDAGRRLARWAAVAVPLSILTKSLQPDAQFTHYVPAWYLRPLVAFDAIGFYALKILWPFSLAVDYRRLPELVVNGTLPWLSLVAAGLLLGACVALARRPAGTRGRWVGAALIAGIVTLLPFLGFVPFAYQALSTVADHYAYTALAAVGAAVMLLWRTGRIARAAAALLLLSFGALSFQRAGAWSDNEAFFVNWIRDNPQSSKGYSGLAEVRFAQGRTDDTITLYREAIALDPLNPVPWANLGETFNRQQQYARVLADIAPRLHETAFLEANRTRPYHMSGVYAAVGFAYLQTGRLAEGFDTICEGARRAPQTPWFQEQLTKVTQARGRPLSDVANCYR